MARYTGVDAFLSSFGSEILDRSCHERGEIMNADALLKEGQVHTDLPQNDLHRSRWDGVLSKTDYDTCVTRGVPIGFDPAQQGWVALDCADAFDDSIAADQDLAPQPGLQLPPMRLRSIDLERRYTLRLWTEQDIPAYVALLDNPKVWALMPEAYPAPLTPELAGDMIAMSSIASRHDVRAVETGGALIGQVRLLHGPEGASDAEISYWLGEPHWGKGHGANMVTLFAYQAFRNDPALRSIFARIHKDNVASMQVARKADFSFESADPADPDWQIWRVQRTEFWLS